MRSTTTDDELVLVLRALSNPTRLQILTWLRDPEQHFATEGAAGNSSEVGVCVSHIQAKVGLAQATVSAYMASLERAGLVRSTRIGRWTHYRRDEDGVERFVAALGRTV